MYDLSVNVRKVNFLYSWYPVVDSILTNVQRGFPVTV